MTGDAPQTACIWWANACCLRLVVRWGGWPGGTVRLWEHSPWSATSLVLHRPLFIRHQRLARQRGRREPASSTPTQQHSARWRHAADRKRKWCRCHSKHCNRCDCNYSRRICTVTVDLSAVHTLNDITVKIWTVQTSCLACCAAALISQVTGLARLSVCSSVPYGLLTREQKDINSKTHRLT